MTNEVSAQAPLQARRPDRGKSRPARPQFLLRQSACPQRCRSVALRGAGDGVHRPVGLRQVDAAQGAQPHVRPLSRPARRRRGDARRREHPLARPRPQSSALAGRNGVPEADAVSDDDLREHRLRRSPLRETAEVRTRRSGRIGAAPRRALDRGQGQIERQRPQPLRRPAAAPVHRPHSGDQPGSDPVRRAGLRPRSDLDGENRRTDRRIVRRLHDRDRHPQHAAGRARLTLYRLHVSGRDGRIRGDERRLHLAARQAHPGYVTGRFG